MRISDWSSDVCSSDLYPFACTCHSLLEFLPTYSTSASARRAGGKSCRNAFAPGWRARRARVPPASLASPYTRPDPGDGPDMRERNFVVAAAVARWTVVLLLAIGLVACERSPQGQLPEASGAPVKAERAQVEGFALVRAYPDQSEDSLAIALEFSQPLVGTQNLEIGRAHV